MIRKLFDFVFCCLSEDQQNALEAALEKPNPKAVYDAQKNLLREKHGYRCNICGKFYPYIELDYQGAQTEPRKYAKPSGKLSKGKKPAVIFCGDDYYAFDKKSLLKFEADSDDSFQKTDEIPIMGDVYLAIISGDKKYIATETHGGTIEIIDVCTKQSIAKKQRVHVSEGFIFTQDNKILFFFEDRIRLWDFSRNADLVLWSVPEKWKQSEDSQNPINIFCKNVFYNSKENAYFFVLDAQKVTYVVAVKGTGVERVIQLPGMPTIGRLLYEETLDQYTLSTKDAVIIYDSSFRVLESIAPPHFVKHHDGGGMFPVTRHIMRTPVKTFLSPDGKWLLLDYLSVLIFVRRKDFAIQYCLYSYTGTVADRLGFLNNSSFWYTWKDSTYIQTLEE